jgi:glyoxylase-like metal-dependent hydrolase (beta-lactamase superfamily II)
MVDVRAPHDRSLIFGRHYARAPQRHQHWGGETEEDDRELPRLGRASIPAPGRERNDLVLWIESRRAVVAGDALVDFGSGLEIPQEWLTKGVTRAGRRG